MKHERMSERGSREGRETERGREIERLREGERESHNVLKQRN